MTFTIPSRNPLCSKRGSLVHVWIPGNFNSICRFRGTLSYWNYVTRNGRRSATMFDPLPGTTLTSPLNPWLYTLVPAPTIPAFDLVPVSAAAWHRFCKSVDTICDVSTTVDTPPSQFLRIFMRKYLIFQAHPSHPPPSAYFYNTVSSGGGCCARSSLLISSDCPGCPICLACYSIPPDIYPETSDYRDFKTIQEYIDTWFHPPLISCLHPNPEHLSAPGVVVHNPDGSVVIISCLSPSEVNLQCLKVTASNLHPVAAFILATRYPKLFTHLSFLPAVIAALLETVGECFSEIRYLRSTSYARGIVRDYLTLSEASAFDYLMSMAFP